MTRRSLAATPFVLYGLFAGFAAGTAGAMPDTPKAAPKASSSAPGAGAPQTDDQKSLYAIGLSISHDLGRFGFNAEEIRWIESGLEDGLLKREKKVDIETQGPKINEFIKARMQAASTAARKAGDEYLAKAAAEPGVVKTASGIIYKEVQAGSGESPKRMDSVKVKYEGRNLEGTVFDSSDSTEFRLGPGLVSCWVEGIQLMKVGGKGRLVCPPDTAYGDRGNGPDISPGATLVFDVELLSFTPAPPPAAPGTAPPGTAPAPPPEP